MKFAASSLVLALLISPMAPAAPDLPLQVMLPEAPKKDMPKIEVKVPVTDLKLPPVRPIELEFPFGGIGHCIRIDGLIDLFGGPENFGAVAVPEKIELIRLKGKVLYPWKPEDFIEARSAPLTDDDGVALRVILTSEATYDWEGGDSECLPPYECRVKFRQKDKIVCVDLSIDCCMMRVVRDGREIAEKNIRYGIPALSKIVSRYFPEIDEAEANNAPLPMRPSVTPRARARVAPAALMAGL